MRPGTGGDKKKGGARVIAKLGVWEGTLSLRRAARGHPWDWRLGYLEVAGVLRITTTAS